MPITLSRRDRADAAFATSTSSGGAGLYPCSICNRTFASDRIQQHEEACRKANKQRRVFDSTKQRLQGSEAAAFYRKTRGGRGSSQTVKPQVPFIFQILFKIFVFTYINRFQNQIGDKNMKILFERFVMQNKRAIMRNQVGQQWQIMKNKLSNIVQGGRLADLPPPPASVNPDYVPCPHCGRNFAPTVAERHIPKCVNILAKPKPPPGLNRMGTQQRAGAAGNSRTTVPNYNSTYGGYSSSAAAYPPSTRTMRGSRY